MSRAAHLDKCRCVECLIKPGEDCRKTKYCIATKGHPGDCVHAVRAPAMLVKLFVLGIARKLGAVS